MQIKGQSVVIAGGASGLGAATARYFATLGARVSVLDFNLEAAQVLADDIRGVAIQADVGDAASIAAAFAQIGPVRVAVNCAGVADAARIVGREGKLSLETFEKVIRVNLIGTYNVMSYAAQAMMMLDPIGEERGVIINTASAAYEDGQLGQAAYAASKGAIASMCLPAAREFAKPGIRVMAIAPGLFHTPMMEALPPETTAQITSNIPFPARLGHPDEFARMAADIVSNPYLNGTVIRLDGAVRLPPR